MPLFFGGGAGSLSNTIWPGPMPTFVPSGILIHSAVWPQFTPTSQTDRTDRTVTPRQHSTINDNDVGSVLLCSGELLGLKSGVNTFDNRRSRTVEGHEGLERVKDYPLKNEVSSRNGLL